MVLCHYCFRVVTTVSASTSSTAQQPYLPSFSQTSKARARLSVPPPLHKPWALLSPTAQVPPMLCPQQPLTPHHMPVSDLGAAFADVHDGYAHLESPFSICAVSYVGHQGIYSNLIVVWS